MNNTLDIYNNNSIEFKKDTNKDYKKIKYTVQGELMLNNKCLNVLVNNDNTNQYAYLQDFQYLDEQRLYPYKDAFTSQFDKIILSDNTAVLKSLSNENKSWLSENTNTEFKTYQEPIQWTVKKGKNVVLIEPDNPWYINIVDKELENNDSPYDDNEYLTSTRNPEISTKKAQFHSNFVINTKRPDMGYGYSIVSRAGKPCICLNDCNNKPIYENFQNTKMSKSKKSKKYILYLSSLLIIIFILVQYLYQQNK